MNVILVLLAASLSLALGFLAAFLWSVRRGQFDDSVTPAMRMLHDDEPAPLLSSVEPSNRDPS